MESKIDNIVRIPCKKEEDFFYYWMAFLKPIHGLNSNGIVMSACFLRHRYALGKVCQDETMIDRTLMSTDTKRVIREECDLSPANFSIILKDLKRKKIIVDNRINPRFIPKISEDKERFQMLILFDFNS